MHNRPSTYRVKTRPILCRDGVCKSSYFLPASYTTHIGPGTRTKYRRASVRNQAASVLSRRSFVVVRGGLHLMQEQKTKEKAPPCPFPIRAGTHGEASRMGQSAFLRLSPAPPIDLSVLGFLGNWVHPLPRSLSGFSMPTTSSYTKFTSAKPFVFWNHGSPNPSKPPSPHPVMSNLSCPSSTARHRLPASRRNMYVHTSIAVAP